MLPNTVVTLMGRHDEYMFLRTNLKTGNSQSVCAHLVKYEISTWFLICQSSRVAISQIVDHPGLTVISDAATKPGIDMLYSALPGATPDFRVFLSNIPDKKGNNRNTAPDGNGHPEILFCLTSTLTGQ